MMRTRPALAYLMLYLTLMPVAAIIMETFFLPLESVALVVPVAGVGLLVMATQFTNMAGSTWAGRIAAHLGEGRVLYIYELKS